MQGVDQTVAEPLPLHRLSRSDDHDTSLEAAIKASKASRRAVDAVRGVMEGRFVGIIDEDIWQECRRAGYISSFDTVRHGRLALSEAGLIVNTGERQTTSNNASSIVWAWHS